MLVRQFNRGNMYFDTYYIKDTSQDSIEFLYNSEDLDEDEINYCLEEFYDLCDDLRAFVGL